MDMEKAKALCQEYANLKKTIKVIYEASEKNWWIAIKTPYDESYLSNIQIKAILDLAESRIKEIENLINN